LSSGQNIPWAAGFIMTLMALNLKQRRYVETVLAGLSHLAEAVAAIPHDWQPAAFQAAERSYLKAFRQLGLSWPQTWASSVTRRLRRRVREAEKEKLTKLYEQLSANEHGSALPFGQAHSFATHEAGLSEERKNVARESVKKDAVAPGMARIQGQRTGIVTNYVDGALAWQHWFSRQIEMRPEIAYYRSLNADAFNGNAAAGIPPSKNWAVIAASDLIIHF
jgi:hypothetical protein